jgi:hypothetical protein
MFFSKIISSISVSTKENDIAKEILVHIKSFYQKVKLLVKSIMCRQVFTF